MDKSRQWPLRLLGPSVRLMEKFLMNGNPGFLSNLTTAERESKGSLCLVTSCDRKSRHEAALPKSKLTAAAWSSTGSSQWAGWGTVSPVQGEPGALWLWHKSVARNTKEGFKETRRAHLSNALLEPYLDKPTIERFILLFMRQLATLER